MGYKQSTNRSDFVLKDTSNLISIITDLVILHEDLTVTLEIVESIQNVVVSDTTVSGRQILLQNVLLSRQHWPQRQSCINSLMSGQSCSPCDTNSVPYSLSMTRDVVVSDCQSSLTSIGSRKNPPKLLSRDGTPVHSQVMRRLSSPPPPDISDLPAPAMTQSQVLKYFEESSLSFLEKSVSPPADKKHDLSDSQERNAFHRQIYKPFKTTTIQPIKFDIGADQEVWSNNTNEREKPLKKHKLPLRGSSFDPEYGNETITKPFRNYSSSGNLDDYMSPQPEYHPTPIPHPFTQYHQPYPECNPIPHPSTQYHQPNPKCHPIPPPSTQYQPHNGYQQNSGYHNNFPETNVSSAMQSQSSGYGRQNRFGNEDGFVVSGQKMTRRASEDNILNINTVVPPNTYNCNYTKDLEMFTTTNKLLPISNNTSSTVCGGDTRQMIRQLSRDREGRQVTSTGAAAVGSHIQYWTCKACKNGTPIGMDVYGCRNCGELSPYIDTGPWKPEDRKMKTNKIETDYSLNQTNSKSRSWECPYCWSHNYNDTNICSECKSDVKTL